MSSHRQALRPALAAGLLYVAVLVSVLVGGGPGPSSFVRFGEQSRTTAHAREVLGPDLVVPPGQGHDGAAFWALARDPFLTDPDEYVAAVEVPGARAARLLYPLIASPWRLGGETSLLWGMVLSNIALVAVGTYLTARLALDLGGPAMAGLAFALNPGVLFSTFMDLSDVLLAALLVGFVWAVHRCRWGPAVLAAALVGLTKESGIVLVAFVGLVRTEIPMRIRIGAPAAAAATFVLWSLYSRWRLGWATDRLAVFTVVPGGGFVDAARFGWIPAEEWVEAITAMAMVAIGIWIVVRWFRRRTLVMTAALSSVLVLPFYDATVFHLVYDSTRSVGAALTLLAVDVAVERWPRAVDASPVGIGGAGPAVT